MEQAPRYASLLTEPAGEVLFDVNDLSKFVGRHTSIVYMNDEASQQLPLGVSGLIGTRSLAGCTGVAINAMLNDGSSMQFLSHYPPYSRPQYKHEHEFIRY